MRDVFERKFLRNLNGDFCCSLCVSTLTVRCVYASMAQNNQNQIPFPPPLPPVIPAVNIDPKIVEELLHSCRSGLADKVFVKVI